MDVTPYGAVSLLFTSAVRPSTSAMVTAMVVQSAHVAAGAPIPVTTMVADDGLSIVVRPVASWPAETVVALDVAPGVVGLNGAPSTPAEPVQFETAALAPVTVSLHVRAPRSDLPAASNLRWLAVTVSPPMQLWQLSLESSDHSVDAAIREQTQDGRVLAELPTAIGRCHPLCPGVSYRVTGEGQAGRVEARSMLVTSTSADDRPPLVSADVRVAGDTVQVALTADEAVLASGRLVPRRGGVVELVASVAPAQAPWLEASGVAPRTRYELHVVAVDLAGNEQWLDLPPVTTPPPVRAVITELVASPTRDWNDSGSGGSAFDAEPGGGAVTDADEWIELVNNGTTAIDLAVAGLRVLTLDASPRETRLEAAPAVRFAAGDDAGSWSPAGALVLRPFGSMSGADLVVELYSGATLLDRWVIGDELDAGHRGGPPPDLLHDAIAESPTGLLRWCRPTPGDPVQSTDCVD